ncbi:TonB-dependent copper receptor [Pseudoalteromonas denitrificans]|uniref:Iron complex outermembrane recepter protein n=1 Tax=Pseudoalteromonas denitrificans DSM 6059 TaxID=1123010 RepID=A0A1I1K718_9GAMM|nr:TonB-dependent copper receptor [Pseudoalteromonas denitrificans]SFC56644.1 iron complex outermembrane recepter protein [Pseudoalteromonas denitrificans DSM 6059]
MNFSFLSHSIAVALLLSSSQLIADDISTKCVEESCFEVIVISAEPMQSPLSTVSDPKQPRQPLPAFDGSGFLKTLPGFTVARKGGSGGDVSLRGLGGSRINIVNDGKQMGGTCGGRMDPPTNYISPETYEKVVVIKGPQTVKYGPVGSAGTVLFERDHYGLEKAETSGRASMTFGSFGRKDYLAELTTGDTTNYWSIDVNGSKSDDYEDGEGRKMQSEYDRQSVHTALGWTPDVDSVVELNYGYSSGSAEYADRGNKARTIDNENISLLVKSNLQHEQLKTLEFQVYGNENDHIMDRFDRPITDIDALPTGANPRRTNIGGYLWLDFELAENFSAMFGLDYLDSKQDMRSGKSLDELKMASYTDLYSKENIGLFIESNFDIASGTLYSGLRWDKWQTNLLEGWAQPTKDNTRDQDLISGFARYEMTLDDHSWVAGFGRAKRIADYWEVMRAGRMLTLEPETTDQMDLGWMLEGDVKLMASIFYADIKDYILIDTQSRPYARNVDVTLWGGEASAEVELPYGLLWVTTIAYSHGDNDTDNLPLGQVSPLEAKLALNYQSEDWSFGALWRIVDKQDRVSVGQGNIVGQDLGKTSGFGVLSINGAWVTAKDIKVSFGVDNLFDKNYAEHVSKSGGGNDLLPLEDRTIQVNEPGQNFWVKLDYQF